MQVILDIPEELRPDLNNSLAEFFFCRVKADIDHNGLCGMYEEEIAEVLENSFRNAKVIE